MKGNKPLKILIVEDNDIRIDQFNRIFEGFNVDIVKTAGEGIDMVNKKTYDYIFLDHDLGVDPDTGNQTDRVFLRSGKGTGYEVARAIPISINNDSTVIVHSWNVVGASNISNVISDGFYAPFGTEYFYSLVNNIKDEKNPN